MVISRRACSVIRPGTLLINALIVLYIFILHVHFITLDISLPLYPLLFNITQPLFHSYLSLYLLFLFLLHLFFPYLFVLPFSNEIWRQAAKRPCFIHTYQIVRGVSRTVGTYSRYVRGKARVSMATRAGFGVLRNSNERRLACSRC